MRSVAWASACILLCAAGAACQATPPAQPPLELSLEKAIELATSTHGDSRVQIALDAEQLSHARYQQARAALLPDLEGSVAEQNQTVNPRALGLRFTAPGFTIPDEVGPFDTFDARIHLTQNLFSFSSIRQWQAAQKNLAADHSGTDSARQSVAGNVARLYAKALWAGVQLEASQANLKDAQALRDLSEHRTAVGEGTELDVARARLNVARAQQHLLSAQTEQTHAQLELIRILNLSWDTTLRLTGKLDTPPGRSPTVDALMSTALPARADFREQGKRVESAQLDASAAQMERLPSLVGYGDYGVLEGVQTHTVGAELRIPLFNGGRMQSDQVQASALLHEQQTRQKDLRNQIELEIREAVATLDATAQGVDVAEQAVTLAQDELDHARHRYEAGVTNSLEVMDAENQLEKARDDRAAAYLDYANARIDLAQATGTTTQLSFQAAP